MQIHDLIQGQPSWLAHRATHFNASDAPAMMGCSPYKTRTQLLHELHTGLTPEVDAATQRRFDDGHRFEALARPLAEEIIGEDLYPVTGSLERLSASFDGLNMAETIAFEHKTLNSELRAAFDMIETIAPNYRDQAGGAELPLVYRVQMEQQLLVSSAEKCLFMASKWDGDDLVEKRHCWYTSDPNLRQNIVDGWLQFAADLAAYVPADVIIAPIAKAQMSLPAVSIQVNGSIALVDNLEAFGTALTAYVARINKEPETDQDFADLEATVKTLKNAEEALEAAENGALAQTESIDSMRRTVGLYRETARTNRLLVEKLVKIEKENRRTKIIGDAVAAFHTHMRGLNERLGKPYMPTIQAEFQQVVKGLKSLDSMKDKVATELARCKIESNATADKIQTNLNTLRELAAAHAFLFADAAQIVLKAPDDLTILVKSRISEHQAAEEKKAEQLRESIRKEESERVEREQRERRADIAAICGWYGNFCNTLESVEIGLQKVAAWAANPSAWGEMIDEAKAAVEEQRVGLEKRREFLLIQQTAAVITHEAVVEIMMPATVVETMKPATDMVRFGSIMVSREQIDKTWPAKVKPAAPPDLRLGQISTRLGFALTAAFLSELGFEPAGRDRAAVLYHEDSFKFICAALVKHISSVCELQAA